jgi:phosphodiesterase/alkaline phosphatase D-like protein
MTGLVPATHSLHQFRGNYKYNLPDDDLRAFNAEVPMLAQWEDHEVTNDWSPIISLTLEPAQRVTMR